MKRWEEKRLWNARRARCSVCHRRSHLATPLSRVKLLFSLPMEPLVHYQCQRCTNCCRWPGFVRVDDADITAIAKHLGMSEHEFIQRYTRLRPRRDGLALVDGPDGACVFLAGRDCAVQQVKPRQCAGFPNTWNFPGWREVCEAVPVPVPAPVS